MMRRAYVDSNVIIYLTEGVPPLKAAALALFNQVVEQQFALTTSEISIGECLIGAKKSGLDQTAAYRELLHDASVISLVSVDQQLIYRAAALGAELNMKLIDAIHVATAEASQCSVFLTNDRGIRAPAGIELRYLSQEA